LTPFVLWSKNVMQRLRVNGAPYPVHDAVFLFVRRCAGKQFVVLKPTLKTFHVLLTLERPAERVGDLEDFGICISIGGS
jgi:hypothetical protein